jgi:hypothetical protein
MGLFDKGRIAQASSINRWFAVCQTHTVGEGSE